MRITRIDAYRVELPLHEGSYKWSGGNAVTVFDSTVVAVATDAGITGYGEVCPLGPAYLPAYAAGARIEVFSMFSARLRLIDVTINNLDHPNHEDPGGIARLEEGISLAEWNLCLIDFDDALQRIAFRIDHRAAQLLSQQPSGLICDA